MSKRASSPQRKGSKGRKAPAAANQASLPEEQSRLQPAPGAPVAGAVGGADAQGERAPFDPGLFAGLDDEFEGEPEAEAPVTAAAAEAGVRKGGRGKAGRACRGGRGKAGRACRGGRKGDTAGGPPPQSDLYSSLPESVRRMADGQAARRDEPPPPPEEDIKRWVAAATRTEVPDIFETVHGARPDMKVDNPIGIGSFFQDDEDTDAAYVVDENSHLRYRPTEKQRRLLESMPPVLDAEDLRERRHDRAFKSSVDVDPSIDLTELELVRRRRLWDRFYRRLEEKLRDEDERRSQGTHADLIVERMYSTSSEYFGPNLLATEARGSRSFFAESDISAVDNSNYVDQSNEKIHIPHKMDQPRPLYITTHLERPAKPHLKSLLEQTYDDLAPAHMTEAAPSGGAAAPAGPAAVAGADDTGPAIRADGGQLSRMIAEGTAAAAAVEAAVPAAPTAAAVAEGARAPLSLRTGGAGRACPAFKARSEEKQATTRRLMEAAALAERSYTVEVAGRRSTTGAQPLMALPQQRCFVVDLTGMPCMPLSRDEADMLIEAGEADAVEKDVIRLRMRRDDALPCHTVIHDLVATAMDIPPEGGITLRITLGAQAVITVTNGSRPLHEEKWLLPPLLEDLLSGRALILEVRDDRSDAAVAAPCGAAGTFFGLDWDNSGAAAWLRRQAGAGAAAAGAAAGPGSCDHLDGMTMSWGMDEGRTIPPAAHVAGQGRRCLLRLENGREHELTEARLEQQLSSLISDYCRALVARITWLRSVMPISTVQTELLSCDYDHIFKP